MQNKDPSDMYQTALLESAKVRLEVESRLNDIKLTWNGMREIATNVCLDEYGIDSLYGFIEKYEFKEYEGLEAYECSGVISAFKKHVGKQIVKWRGANLSLSDIGSMTFMTQKDRSDFFDFKKDVLIYGAEPGATTIITGVPKSGKTHTAINEIGANAIHKGIRVSSNVQVKDNGDMPNIDLFRYSYRLSDALIYFCENCIEGLEKRGKIFMTYQISDEMVIFRQKMKQSSNAYLSMKMLSHLYRHFGVHEVGIEQILNDTPPEMLNFMSHHIHKPSFRNQDWLDFRRYDVYKNYNFKNVVGWEKKKEMGMPYLEYRGERPTTMKVDVNVPTLLNWVLEKTADKGYMDSTSQYEEVIDFVRKHRHGFYTIDVDQILDVLFLIKKQNPSMSYARLTRLVGWDEPVGSQTPKQALDAGRKKVTDGIKERESNYRNKY